MKHNIKKCLELLKKIIVLLTNLVNASNHTKCISLNNQKSEIQLALFINLHPNEYSQELHYYPFAFKLDTSAKSCNTLNDLSNRSCASNKTEDLNIPVPIMITMNQKF